MDTAIVSIGTTERPGAKGNPNFHVSKKMIMDAGFPEDQHEKAYLGDIGGVWLKRPNLSDTPKRTADTNLEYTKLIEDRWMGVTFEHLKKCVENASATDSVGVIAIAAGKERGEALIEALRSTLLNRLIIDSDLAEHLNATI